MTKLEELKAAAANAAYDAADDACDDAAALATLAAAADALSSIWIYLGVQNQTACMYALEELKKHKENGAMTKLEELKMAYDAASAAYDAADDACDDAVDAYDAAWDAYYDEVKRVQEEHYNDY